MIQLTVIIAIRNYIFETKMMSDCSLLVVIESVHMFHLAYW